MSLDLETRQKIENQPENSYTKKLENNNINNNKKMY